MKLQDRLATRIREESYGGLLLCGMNWGGSPAKSASDQGGWADFFADDKTNRDKYQPRIKQWFHDWGFPLTTTGSPTKLDLCISQTNFFLDQSQSFGDIPRPPESWTQALEVLADTIRSLQIQAVILFSTTIATDAASSLSRIAATTWQNVVGDRLLWTEKKHGRLKLRFARNVHIPFANTCHPRFSPTTADLSSSRAEMEPWLARFLADYEEKQDRTKKSRYPVRRADAPHWSHDVDRWA